MGPYGALHAFVKIGVLNWAWINVGEPQVTLRAIFNVLDILLEIK